VSKKGRFFSYLEQGLPVDVAARKAHIRNRHLNYQY